MICVEAWMMQSWWIIKGRIGNWDSTELEICTAVLWEIFESKQERKKVIEEEKMKN